MKGKITERIVVLKALNGNKEAFSYIFDKYHKKIYRFILFKISTPELAEDLTSQVFLQVWEHILNKNKIKQLQAFIYQVARNKVIDYYRNKEKEELPLIFSDNYLTDQKSDQIKFDGEVSLNKTLDNQSLIKVINQLKGNYREVIVLRFVEELSIKEIAKILNKSKVNIRVLIHRALKELKDLLGQ